MPSSRTHYELLNVDRSAGFAAIKTAFREQVARYHPDKVVHLGQEFQDLAELRTAELTAAYKTLIDPALRIRYDATLAASAARGASQPDQSANDRPRFAAERAGGDGIVHRAILGRVRSAVSDIYGPVECPRVRGFELVLIPTASPPMMRSPLPRIFTRLRDFVDAVQMREACVEAARAGLHVPGSPINVLLFGKRLNDETEILMACEQMCSGRPSDVPAKTHVVVIDAADWRAIFAAASPPALRRFIDRLRG